MQTRPYIPRRHLFVTIRSEGGLLPAGLLERISAADRALPGLTPDAYHLLPRERLAEGANRAWNACQAAWKAFGRARDGVGPDDPGTGLTRERWLLPLFAELGYGRLLPARSIQVDGKDYNVSHGYNHSPIHLVGCGVDLDRRSRGVAGAARSSPHSLVQELLNRSDERLWGFVSNGLRLRILRDNQSLTRQSYVEFDLQAMMDGEVFADFVLLWLLCHQSRIEAERPPECWLEQWSREGQATGERLREKLRGGVEEAIGALGSGFLAQRAGVGSGAGAGAGAGANVALRERLYSGALPTQHYYRQLLRLVYRLLFLFVAEDRDLLLDPAADVAARERYTRYYSTARLRHLAGRRGGTAHHDLYRGLCLVMEKLGSDAGCPELGLPALGGFLFSPAAMPDLRGCDLGNDALLAAVRALAYTAEGTLRLPVDYRNMGAEELGSVYESLLELHPALDADAAAFAREHAAPAPERTAFALKRAAGNDRKKTGSYYTPDSLVSALLDTALDPVLDRAARERDAEAAILRLKVCDPACGSAHFLIAAAHRMARRLAAARTGDEEPAPEATRAALRDVIGRCIYGVDVNPMAVELCKVSLWLEALEPGKPLSFLDAHIQCGNSLLGATPRLLDEGIPNAAFDPIEGDDKAYCTAFRKDNDRERKGQQRLPDGDAPWERLGDLAAAMAGLDALDDDRIAGIRRKEEQYAALVRSNDYRFGRLRADAWCAAFVWHKTKPVPPGTAGFQPAPVTTGFDYPITDGVYRRIERNPYDVPLWMRDEIARLAGTEPGVDIARDQGASVDAEARAYGTPPARGNPPLQPTTAGHGEPRDPRAWGGSRGSDPHQTRRPGTGNDTGANTDERSYNFLHWHLAFPDVFRIPAPGEAPENAETGWSGGFDVVIGNPPWERIKLQEKEWFEDHGRPDIAGAANAARRQRMIAALIERGDPNLPAPACYDPALHAAFLADRRRAEGESHLVRDSGRYPLTAVGDVNTYAIFAETFRTLLNGHGRTGFICPTGIATDDSTKRFFGDLVQRKALVSLFGFKNEEFLFAKPVEHTVTFALLTILGSQETSDSMEFTWLAYNVEHMNDPMRRHTLTAEDIALVNPNTKTCPIFRGARDAELTKAIYRRVPVLVAEQTGANPWGISFLAMLHMSNDSNLFHDAPGEGLVPLYEAKLLHQFDHRWATYDGGDTRDLADAEKADPNRAVTPRYWVPRAEVEKRLRDKGWEHGWLLGFRDIARNTDSRTAIFSLLPRVGVGHTAPLMLPMVNAPDALACLLACLNSSMLDYIARQKVGGTHLTYSFLRQFPVLPPETYDEPACWTGDVPLREWIASRVLELVYTAWDMAPFARDLGYDGPPFRWDAERRFLLRCELDAAYFHLYGLARDDVAYVMETFPIVRRDDEKRHGCYRTRDTILSIYDAMAASMRDPAEGMRYNPA